MDIAIENNLCVSFLAVVRREDKRAEGEAHSDESTVPSLLEICLG